MGRRRTGLADGAWPEDSEDTEWLEVPEADPGLHAGLSVSFEDEHESQLALEDDGSWDQDADYEAGLALEDMGLLEEDAEFAVAGYASTDSEDLWDAYTDDDTDVLAGYNGDRPSPAFSDARSAHVRGSGSGKGAGAKGKSSKGAKGKSTKGTGAKGSKGKGKPTSKGGKQGPPRGHVMKPGSGKSKREIHRFVGEDCMVLDIDPVLRQRGRAALPPGEGAKKHLFQCFMHASHGG